MDALSFLRTKFTEEQISAMADAKVEEMAGFITRDAALEAIARENGRAKFSKKRLFEMQDGDSGVEMRVEIDAVHHARTTVSGKRVRQISVSDGDARAEITLWNSHCEQAAHLRKGDTVDITGAYMKNGALSIGYSGGISVAQRKPYSPISALGGLRGERVSVRGTVSGIAGVRDGAFVFNVREGEAGAQVSATRNPGAYSRLKEGMAVIVENALVSEAGLSAGEGSRILVSDSNENDVSGTVGSMDVSQGGLSLRIGEKDYTYAEKDALSILGVAALPEGVSFSTIVECKRGSFIGKKIRIRPGSGEKPASALLS
jgi:hypothetical protein